MNTPSLVLGLYESCAPATTTTTTTTTSTTTTAAPVTITKRVAANADDWSLYSIWAANNPMMMGNFFSTARCGMRFTGIDIPAGKTITAAKVTLNVVGGQAGDGNTPCNVKIWGNLADNPAAPTTQGQDDALALTTAAVTWTAPTWGAADTTQDTPSLVSIIQELYNAGYLTGSKSCIILIKEDTGCGNSSRRTSTDYNSSSSKAPLLTITYQ